MSVSIAIDLNNPDSPSMQQAANVIHRGGLIVYPTETLYGIGVNALDGAAIRKLQTTKQRPDTKPILVIVNSHEMLHPLVDGINDHAGQLMERFWPGPLTLIFRASQQVPKDLAQGRRTIGVRIPSSKLCLSLLSKAQVPLTSTSANVSGQASERTIERIREQLNGIDLYLDAGELPESLPSTIVDTTMVVPRILRSGAIPLSKLTEVIPDIELSPSVI